MRALVLNGPGAAVLGTVPDPEPKDGEVLLRVRRVGMCGSDLNSYRGGNPLVSYPRILGHEIAGTIVTAPPGLPLFSAGVDVAVQPYTSCGDCPACRSGRQNACRYNQTLGVQRDGAMAEYLAIAPEKLYAAQLGIEALCLVEPLTVGFHAVARGGVQEKDTVAVLGCGGVGLGAIAGAAARGARVLAVDRDEAKLQLAKRAGAAEGLNITHAPALEQLLAFTGGDGPDVVIEAIGLPETFCLAVDAVAWTGRVVYVGYAKEPVAYETKLFVQKELDIRGSRNALPLDFRAVIALLKSGAFPVEAAISHRGKLEDAPGLLRSWSESPSQFSKVMISLD